MDDDFTFPTVAASVPVLAPEEQHDLKEAPFPAVLVGPITSPLWPFSSSPKIKTTATVDEEDAPSTSTRIGGHALQHDDEDRMDLLWEGFNDDVKLPRRRRPDSPDTESDETSTTSGCAPTTMLRASSRAGGAGQFCSSNRSGRGSRTTGWTLLLRLFQRLFAVDNKPPSRSSRHHDHGIDAS